MTTSLMSQDKTEAKKKPMSARTQEERRKTKTIEATQSPKVITQSRTWM